MPCAGSRGGGLHPRRRDRSDDRGRASSVRADCSGASARRHHTARCSRRDSGRCQRRREAHRSTYDRRCRPRDRVATHRSRASRAARRRARRSHDHDTRRYPHSTRRRELRSGGRSRDGRRRTRARSLLPRLARHRVLRAARQVDLPAAAIGVVYLVLLLPRDQPRRGDRERALDRREPGAVRRALRTARRWVAGDGRARRRSVPRLEHHRSTLQRDRARRTRRFHPLARAGGRDLDSAARSEQHAGGAQLEGVPLDAQRFERLHHVGGSLSHGSHGARGTWLSGRDLQAPARPELHVLQDRRADDRRSRIRRQDEVHAWPRAEGNAGGNRREAVPQDARHDTRRDRRQLVSGRIVGNTARGRGDVQRLAHRRRHRAGVGRCAGCRFDGAAVELPAQHRLVLRPRRTDRAAADERRHRARVGDDHGSHRPVADEQRPAHRSSGFARRAAAACVSRDRHSSARSLQAGEHAEAADGSQGEPSRSRLRRGGRVQLRRGAEHEPAPLVECARSRLHGDVSRLRLLERHVLRIVGARRVHRRTGRRRAGDHAGARHGQAGARVHEPAHHAGVGGSARAGARRERRASIALGREQSDRRRRVHAHRGAAARQVELPCSHGAGERDGERRSCARELVEPSGLRHRHDPHRQHAARPLADRLRARGALRVPGYVATEDRGHDHRAL